MLEALSYDDVLLLPKTGVLRSRKDADITSEFVPGWELQIPIIAANMPAVTGWRMACAMDYNGGGSILPRFNTIEEALDEYQTVYHENFLTIPSIGLEDYERAEAFDGISRAICVDVAHGDNIYVIAWVDALVERGFQVIAGNVATYDGARKLLDKGAVAIKVGVGPGAACTTREVTGFGMPQLSAIHSVAAAIDEGGYDARLIADGGIKNSGDIVKALAAGADSVMIGRLFAGTDESPHPGEYFGNASAHVRDYRAPEGVHGTVERQGSVEDVIKSLAWGIRSGLSYGGARNLQELRAKAEFVRVTPLTAHESGVRL